MRTESAIDTLERVKDFLDWIKEGHINGDNTHNVSATLLIKECMDEKMNGKHLLNGCGKTEKFIMDYLF
jgi:hypothetical protein